MTKLKISKEEYVNKTFRLSKKLVREMDRVCDEKGISLNKLVDISIKYAFANLDKGENDE